MSKLEIDIFESCEYSGKEVTGAVLATALSATLLTGAIIRGKRPCGKIMDDKFLLSFPEINKEWFLTGVGDMLNEGYTTFDPVGVPTAPNLENEIILLKAKLEEKEKMIELLKQQLEELNNLNKGLMTTLTNVATSRTSTKKVAEE
mgnify:CR=1 FL=1